MKLTRRQLRILIENAMSDTLDQLDAAAKPVMDLMVEYLGAVSGLADWTGKNARITKAEIFLPKFESALRNAVSGLDETSVFAKISELHSKYRNDGTFDDVNRGFSPMHVPGQSEGALSGFINHLFEDYFGLPYSKEVMDIDKYKTKYSTQGRYRWEWKEPVSQSIQNYERDFEREALRIAPLSYKLLEFSK